jgi:hypothetical protein
LKKWNQRFTFVANFVDVLAFIESSGPRSYEVEYDGHVFACRIDEAIDHSAVACLTTEVHAWRKAHGHRAGDAQPCARTQLRLVQDRVDECIGYYSIHLIDPTAVIGARAIEAARCEAAIRAFLAKQWAQFISLWVKHSKQSNGEAAAPRPRGGRPRDPNDDWAHEQVTLGRPRPEVYGEWLLRIGERADLLADPQHTFTQALALRSKKPQESQ